MTTKRGEERKEAMKAVIAELLGDQTVQSIGDMTVEHSAETQTIILPGEPTPMPYEVGAEWLTRMAQEQDTEVRINCTFPCFPLEGAYALAKAIKRVFGFSSLRGNCSMCADPPTMLSVPTGFGQSEQVPWGVMELPILEGGNIETTNYSGPGKFQQFRLKGSIKRKFEPVTQRIIDEIRVELRERPLFRGHSAMLKLRDSGGELITDDMLYLPAFMDVSGTTIDDCIFTDELTKSIYDQLLVPIRYPDAVESMNECVKRGFLFSGPFGTGKSMLARAVALYGNQQGWAFFHVDDVDDIDAALDLAARYQPAIVFAEDIDRVVSGERDSKIDRILNTLDGVAQKNHRIITILTTNDQRAICKALMRTGRIDQTFNIGNPDAQTCVRILRAYGGKLVSGTDDEFAPAVQPLVDRDANASAIHECVKRAKYSAIGRTGGKTRGIKLTPADIHSAALSLSSHMEMLHAEQVQRTTPMGDFGKGFGLTVGKELRKAVVDTLAKYPSLVHAAEAEGLANRFIDC
jgi:hypothetical protein